MVFIAQFAPNLNPKHLMPYDHDKSRRIKICLNSARTCDTCA